MFSEIISIGGKNWQIGGKKDIGEGSGGRLRPTADPGQSPGRGPRRGKAPRPKKRFSILGPFSWPLRLSAAPLSLAKKCINSSLMNHIFNSTEILKVKTYTLHTFSFKHIFVG